MALARDSQGFTQTDLAREIGVKQGTISKYEAGLLAPPTEFVEALSSALGFEMDFIFQADRPYGMPPFHYRRRKKLGAKALAKIVAEMNIRRMHVATMLRSYDARSNGFIPEIDRDEYRGGHGREFTVDDAARHVREMWMIPDGPIDNVIDLLEENGGIVIPCNFESDLIDAVSQRIDGMPVLFFVNMNAPADRIRWTLCHELGHMVLHTTAILGDEEMEAEADRFAGAFLLPERELRRQLKKFDLRQVANLKRYWKVSMQAIAMRAFHLKLITPYQRKMFFIQMGKLQMRKNEPYEPPRESPRKIKRMLRHFRSVLEYTTAEMARALFVSEAKLAGMYDFADDGDNNGPGNGADHLRII